MLVNGGRNTAEYSVTHSKEAGMVAQQVKTATCCASIPYQRAGLSPDDSTSIHINLTVPGKAVEHGSTSVALTTHVKHLDEVMGPDLDLVQCQPL